MTRGLTTRNKEKMRFPVGKTKATLKRLKEEKEEADAEGQ